MPITRRALWGLLPILLLGFSNTLPAADTSPGVKPSDRMLILGDSNTFAGGYVTLLETWLMIHQPEVDWTIVNLGLPSETASGESEPAHPFPRPCVHERLTRALEKFQPTVVTLAYGMNDGIYHPPSKERLASYQSGITKAYEQCKKAGASVYLVTPPMFDALPLRAGGKLKPVGEKEYAWFAPYENYDDALGEFADWIKTQGPLVAGVVDTRTPIVSYVQEQRKTKPAFTMASDGIHFDASGHEIVARQVWKTWNRSPADPVAAEADAKRAAAIQPLIEKKQNLLLHAWLSHVGHQRPGIEAGLPLAEAEQQAAEIRVEIRRTLAQ
jgi:lysophospholipase L1-like esterase